MRSGYLYRVVRRDFDSPLSLMQNFFGRSPGTFDSSKDIYILMRKCPNEMISQWWFRSLNIFSDVIKTAYTSESSVISRQQFYICVIYAFAFNSAFYATRRLTPPQARSTFSAARSPRDIQGPKSPGLSLSRDALTLFLETADRRRYLPQRARLIKRGFAAAAGDRRRF